MSPRSSAGRKHIMQRAYLAFLENKKTIKLLNSHIFYYIPS